MKAAGITEYRGPVSPLDLAAPTLAAPHQLLIEVYAAGVGNWDDIVRTGAWDIGAVPPMALGVEASGVVRGVGREVSRFRAGDQVLTHSVPIQQGTWAELFVARQEHVAHKPSNMPWLEAALFPVPALTAHQVLGNALALQPGETVLIHGAGGVTGGVLVALASDMGVRVIATAGPQSMDRVRRYGASLTVDYHVVDWPLQVRAAAGDRLPAVVNAVRGEATRLISIVADGGRLATITGDPPSPERCIGY